VPSQRNIKFGELKELKVEMFIRLRLDTECNCSLFPSSFTVDPFPEAEFMNS